LEARRAAPPPFLGEARFSLGGAPVVGVNWSEAVSYCEWLGEGDGARYRLPSEAEREWAARGGLGDGDWPWEGDGAGFIEAISRFEGPHEPGPACANGYGLRCMAENVHEWCGDWYAPDYYVGSPRDSPRGPQQGKRRVSRGGSWRHREKVTRVNARSSLDPAFRYSDFGFRVYQEL
ncbi:MAG: SUMF1/EgtB/PvdO family nonheme iron enzyme, partial [Tepidiformaceae bacterium]